VPCRQVIRKLKQKLTAMEVQLYKVEEEEEVQPATHDDTSGTFGDHKCLHLVDI